MADESMNNPGSDVNQNPADPNDANQAANPNPANDSVSISKHEFASLMTEIAMLRTQIEDKANPAEPQPKPVNPYEGKDINQLTNAELLDIINRQNETNQQAVINAIMQVAIKEEIRDLGDKFSEFKTDQGVREAVFKIAEKNTHLSLEQAYLIHKGAAPAPKPAPASTSTIPTPIPTPASKPGVSTPTVKENKPLSVREAAELAFKSLNYQG